MEAGHNNENIKLNSTLGYLRTENDKMNEKTINGDISAKEKKFLELNPNLKRDELKELKEKKNDDLKMTKRVSLNFDKPNNSKFNRVKTNTSNIFHNQVKILNINIFKFSI